jgi:PKD repeat protein
VRKGLLRILLLLVFLKLAVPATGQTIALGNLESGPYGQGSTISVKITNGGSGCFPQSNTFQLYLSDANGNFATENLIGSFKGFYGTFVNGIIPVGTPAGTNYKLRVKSTAPVVISNIAGSINISAAPGVVASVTSQSISTTYPEVFGSCSGSDNVSYGFTDNSTNGATVTANFYNELASADEGTFGLAQSINFNAKAANYTVNVKAVKNGIAGVYAYTLINNVVNSNFGTSGSNTICLGDAAAGLTYNVDISTMNGLQRNYPGLVYSVKWGDGRSDLLTLCDLLSSGGKLSHAYTTSSCGNVTTAGNNIFEVDLLSTSPYCGKVGTQVTSYAKVLNPPTNRFQNPGTGCTGTPVVFNNTSFPGQDPAATGSDCAYVNAQYTWTVDGVQYPNYSLYKPFTHVFTTKGTHRVTIHLQNNNGLCPANDVTQEICIQDPPKPSFTLPATVCLAGGIVAPVNTSVNDNTCTVPAKTVWHVTGPAPVTYSGNTDTTSLQPQILFSKVGTYKIGMGMNGGCDVISTPEQTVIVTDIPKVTLSADIPMCGKGQVLSFNTDKGSTTVSYTGTADSTQATYNWVITAPVGAGAATFVNNTSAASQYPQISFPDYGTYAVTVTYTNSCGVDTKTQNIIFQESPTVNVIVPQLICANTAAQITGLVTNGTYKSFKWMGGNGTFIPDRTSTLTPTYLPSAAETAAGSVALTLDVTTTLLGTCSDIEKTATLHINPILAITSPAAKAICTGTNFGYHITSTVPGSTYTWTAVTLKGSVTGLSTTGRDSVIDDILVNPDLSNNAIVAYTITPHSNGCDGAPLLLTVNVSPTPLISHVADEIICSGSATNITLSSNASGKSYTWTSTVIGGDVSVGNTTQNVAIATSKITDVLVNNGNSPITVIYTITPIGNCDGTSATVKITVQPAPLQAKPGADDEVCATNAYKLNGNDPQSGTGKWTLDSGQPGVFFTDDTRYNTTVTGLQPGNVYKFRWTITNLSPCAPASNVVTITVDNATVAGTTTGATTTCAGNNNGLITLTGHVGRVLRWEESIDGGTSWQNVNNTTAGMQYLNLKQTTQYRAVVESGVCDVLSSTISTITVNQPAIVANAGDDQTLCHNTTATLTGNDPLTFTGYWKQTAGPLATIVSPSTYKTDVTGLIPGNVYKFAWVIKGAAPCGENEDEVIITDQFDIKASFTADKNIGCGAYTVNFSNTSNSLTGSFVWDFGDGSAQSAVVSPAHTFKPATNGKDTVYTVSLNVAANCNVRPAATYQILVRPPVPVVAILPASLSGCTPYAITVKNTSPGNNQSYTYYLYDGAAQLQQITLKDKSDAVFNPVGSNTTKIYTVYMVATDFCGTIAETKHLPITVSPPNITPQMFVQNNATRGCAPFVTTFVNNSNGGINFTYNIYDAGNKLIDKRVAGTADFPYAFTTPGTYFVTITAADNCTVGVESAPTRIDVSIAPTPQFVADVTSGCTAVTVNFTNNTPDTKLEQAVSYTYDWDFGDGSAHYTGFKAPAHNYISRKTPYTVTLTATSPVTGCYNSVVMSNIINVVAPPATAFKIQPDSVREIPDYNFAFADQSTGGPVSWIWNFGDGKSSKLQNPEHTYADTGRYKVTLITANATGCTSSVTHYVRIKGVPGQLFLPNAFLPGSLKAELKNFNAKGSGLKEWRLQIYNNAGQKLWETTKLDAQGSPAEGWDGTYNGTLVPQGSYIWQVSARFINGTEWIGMKYRSDATPKRSGTINLIR